MQTPRRNDGAAGHRLRVYLRKFEELEKEIQVTKVCESAGFRRRVSVGMQDKTMHDVNNHGFEGCTGVCREYTLSRDDPESEVKLWIHGHTRIGLVLQVKTTCYLDIYGIEIPISSTSGDSSKYWVFITRCSNRYVEELRYNDPDYSLESFELANYWSTEETHARLPATQSNPLGNDSEVFIPIAERKWNDILAYENCKGYTLESSISKLVTKLVRHLDREEREADGASSLEIDGSKAAPHVSDSDWINRIW